MILDFSKPTFSTLPYILLVRLKFTCTRQTFSMNDEKIHIANTCFPKESLESVTNLVFVYLSYLKIIPNYVTSEKSK